MQERESLASQIATAPVWVMPEPAQTIFLVFAASLALAVLIYGLVLARQYNSIMPVLLPLAGFCAIPLETIVTYLGHATHATVGNIALFRAVDRTIPWYIAFGYMAGFGLLYLLLYKQTMDRTLTRKFIWSAGFVAAGCYYLAEIAGVSTGLWGYFEPQPIWIWKMTAPPTWSFLNATCELFGGCLIMFLLPELRGIKQALVLVLAPMGAFMGHLGAGFPFYNAINADVSPLVMNLSALFSIGLCLVAWWIASILATIRLDQVKAA